MEKKIMRLISLLFLPFLILSIVHAQINSKQFNNDINKTGFFNNLENDINSFYKVGIGFLESPSKFTTEDYILSGLIVGGTALSFTLDNPIHEGVRRAHSLSMDKITTFGEKFGNPRYGIATGGILYLGGHLLGDKYLRETGQILAEATLLNGIVTQGLKMLLGRSRPYTNEGNFDIDFFGMELEGEDQSLPSGHTSNAFAIATVLSQRIDNLYASIAFYSLAGLTAYQRIYNNKHWFSDTVLGAALGTVIGLKVIKLHTQEKSSRLKQMEMNVIPSISSKGYGLGLSLMF
jgi:membrane-associated phospholipid phosphatase